MDVFLSLYVCPQVVFLDKSNITLFACRFSFGHILCHRGHTFDPVGRNNNISDYSFTEVLLFQHVCSHVVLLDESNIALFAPRFTFCLKQSRGTIF